MDFVFLSTQGWNEMGGAGRPLHFFARELLARGHRVLFVEVVTSENATPREHFRLVSFAELGYDERALRRAWYGLDPQLDARPAFASILEAFETRGAERVVVYGDPFVPFVEWFELFRTRGYKIVYDALDDFEAFPEIGLYFANDAAERFLVAHSDLVIAVSTTLVEKLSAWEPHAPVHLVRQGFDTSAFRAAAIPREGGGRDSLVLGFWGHVNAVNLDVDLLEHVARARPQWTLRLIGPIDHDPQLPKIQERLRALSNVQLTGKVAHEELPRYLQEFDAAIIPFHDTAFNRARDPLKVYEYLSGYKPVVAANMPQLDGMPYVYLARTPDEFLAAVERAVMIPVDRAVIDAYLRDCTWSARLDLLLGYIAQIAPSRAVASFDAKKTYADADSGTNVREYIARTEQLLQERTKYARALELEATAKQTHIDRLQQTNPFWQVKRLIARE